MKAARMGYFSPILVVLIILMSIQQLPVKEPLSEQDRREQFGGGSFEERCGSITFEDMFIYDQAIFEVKVEEDWKSAHVDARAWINWTLADQIRSDLDSYLEGLIPSGGDGWLSTDEIETVIAIAADCLEYSITRIGIRDGSPHRGGVGVGWENTSWESDGMIVGHYNGIPLSHSQGRDCQGFSQEGCYEIPVVPSVERDCDTGLNQSGADECRVELWLNATMLIEGVSDPNNFTIAFNSSNMSNARLEFTFPTIPDLRLDMWEECEGRFVGPDEENPHTDSSPVRGSCIGDGSANHTIDENDDGSITYTLNSNFSREIWPRGEDVFADFTTSPIPMDRPPTWTSAAPVDGAWIPVQMEGATKLSDWNEMSKWFYDESGSSSLDIICITGGNVILQSFDGSMWINVDGIVEVTCGATDSIGQQTGNRTWKVGVPVTISTTNLTLEEPHPIMIELNQDWEFHTSVIVSFTQGGEVHDSGIIIENASTQELEIMPIGMVPGPVHVWIRVESGGLSYEMTIDLGIEKESSPPTLMVSSTMWEDGLWKIGGQYSDPDGQEVYFSLSIDEVEFGEVLVSGNSWESVWLDLSDYNPGIYTVEVSGCDESGKCTMASHEVDSSALFEGVEEEVTKEDGDSGSVPSSGILTLFLAISAAILFRRGGR
ncbi:MAG: hypothetical protein CMB67_04035 [Euryarchaeota archaeon]|nr:hypothetical protein [Euryarchaeota archaeon]